MAEIFSNDHERQLRVENALVTANRYDWETSTSDLFAFYDKMHEEFSKNRAVYVYKKSTRDYDSSEESISPA